MHIYKSELGVIARNSLRNCHIQGMDSVMFNNTPGGRVRAFILRPDHDMYHNVMGDTLSLSIHPHHCDIELKSIFGPAFNVIPFRKPRMIEFPAWEYRSAITTGKGEFTRLDSSRDFECGLEAFPLEEPWMMAAKELHTWFVPKGEEAAWMVHEWREDPTYDPTCWSNADLTKFDQSKFYLPMDIEYLKGLLDKMKVHVL